MFWSKKNKSKPNVKKSKSMGAIAVKPQFTVDRLFIYMVGGAATLAGLYVIWKFVEQGLNKGENKGEQDGSITKLPEKSALYDYKENAILIPDFTKFPITYVNLYAPTFRTEVQALQQMLIDKGFKYLFPVYGADGLFGPETLNAIQTVWNNRSKTKVTRDEFIAFYNETYGTIKALSGLGNIDSNLNNLSLMSSLVGGLGSLGCAGTNDCGCGCK